MKKVNKSILSWEDYWDGAIFKAETLTELIIIYARKMACAAVKREKMGEGFCGIAVADDCAAREYQDACKQIENIVNRLFDTAGNTL